MEFLDLRDMEEEHAKVCRVCLIMDVKMYSLQAYPLDTYFEAIIGIPVISTMELPPYLCYECAGYVRKFCLFKDRCLRGQTVLYGILQAAGKVTEEDIKKIDRKSMHVTSSLCIKETSSHLNVSYNENSSLVTEIKQEPIIVNQDGIELSVELGCVKEELDFPLDDIHHSSDDEPLSIHKTIKEKKKGKKRGRKRKADREQEKMLFSQIFEEDSEIAQEACEVPATSPVGKSGGRKGARPARRTNNTGGVDTDDINLEDYVTIVTLTLEEQLAEIAKRKESSNYLNAPFQCSLCFKGFIDTNAWKHHLGKHDPSAGEVECSICKFRFPSRRALQKHAVNHEKKYACNSCSYVSKTTTQAKQHQRWHKGVTYTCEYCDEVSTKWTSYLSHVRIKHPSQHICPVCGYSFVSRLGLTMHRTMMHKQHVSYIKHPSQHICPVCGFSFVSRLGLTMHRTMMHKQHVSYIKHPSQHICPVCGFSFVSRLGLTMHRTMMHKQHVSYIKHLSQHICPVCGFSFVSRLGLTMHRTMMHKQHVSYIKHPSQHICPVCGFSFEKESDAEDGPYCADCDVKFVSSEAYNRHMVTSVKHSVTNNFSLGCRVCGATFPSPEELRLHHRKLHARTRPKNYGKKKTNLRWPAKCEHCSEEIENAREQWTHFRRAHPDKAYPIQKDYVCDVCGKSFRGNAFLNYHKRTHTEERAYKCGACGKAFFNRTNLNMHERTHSDLRPYVCDVCCKAFKCKGALDRHYRSHTGEKPYNCEVCGKSFGQSNSRKLHVRTVHLRQPAPYIPRNTTTTSTTATGRTLAL